MARAKSKQELVESHKLNFRKLLELLETISTVELNKKIVFGNQTVKDILAHLTEWHQMFFEWYGDGSREFKTEMPKKGFTWKQIPELNHRIYLKYKDKEYEEIYNLLQGTHNKLSNITVKHSEEELFTKKLFTWTGSTSLASYIISAGPSHYLWAYDLIRKTSS
jgi:hypothetical protein